jgi:hypothetical protein
MQLFTLSSIYTRPNLCPMLASDILMCARSLRGLHAMVLGEPHGQ